MRNSYPLLLLGSSDGSSIEGKTFVVERDASGALALRERLLTLTTYLTLSSAEHRRLPARTGAITSVAREQELTGASMTG